MSLILVETYFIICFLILFYTIGYIAYKRFYRRREARHIDQYIKMISDQHLMLQQVGCIDQAHRLLLTRKFRNIDQLIAFEKALNQMNSSIDEYLEQIESVIVELTAQYQHFDQMKQAYLSYFIAKHAAKGNWEAPVIYQLLTSYLDHPTIYLRENVLLAVCQQPDSKWIIKVLHYLTENKLFHHPKLIQDALLTYPFDSEELIDVLWGQRKSFQLTVFLGLIGFITFKSDNYKEAFHQLLKQEKLDLEVRTKLMRYLKKHHLAEAEPLLISLTSDQQSAIRIVAVNTLGEYPSEKSIAALKAALKDRNWHVRRNASQSLLSMDLSESDISDILEGDDRYAKEMLRYHLEEKRGDVYESVR